MKKYLKPILLSLLLIAVAIAVYWLWFKPAKQVEYLTETVQRGDIRQTVNATGEVSAAQLLTVGAQASGQIKKLHVVLGQVVKQGDLIAEIDATTQSNELSSHKAKLETYQAQLNARQIALEIAAKQYRREQQLLAEDATAQASLESAKDNWAQAKANVAETQSLIKQTRIAVNTAETNLGYTRIVAPLDGTIVSIPVEAGQTVNANQNTPTIVQIADLSKMQIRMQISEGDVTKIKVGMPVSYSILSQPNQIYRTTLHSIDPGLTTLSQGNYSGTTDSNSAVYYYGKLLVANDDGLLHIGMTTQNVITVAEMKNVLRVPNQTIRKGKEGKRYVQVLQGEGRAQRVVDKPVTVGLSDGIHTEIKSGLAVGERVVSAQMSDAEINNSTQGSAMGRPPRM